EGSPFACSDLAKGVLPFCAICKWALKMCENSLYPDCLNPEDCESKSSNWVKVTERFKDSATKHHERIIQKMNYLIPSGEHAEQSMSANERMVSSEDVKDVIEFGEAISSRRASDGSIKLIVSG